MIFLKNRSLHLLLCLILLCFSHSEESFSQNKKFAGFSGFTEALSTRQDTSVEFRRRNAMTAAEPDTNFTYEKYSAFLKLVSDTSMYVVLPINEFRETFKNNKIVIGLRHDVDLDLNKALQFSETESNLGVRSTYYILHTASYYLSGGMESHSASMIPILKTMQNDKHFEIGWHNDLVTLQAVYNIDPGAYLRRELTWLRENGINIYGSASHGSPYCYTYKYLNYYFFEECTSPVVGQFTNNKFLPLGGSMVPMKKGRFIDFDLKYEAYFLNNNKYFSDASITNGVRWNIGMLDISQLQAGDRVIILLHPVHWHKASVNAKIETFTLPGQIRSTFDNVNSTISVEMPFGTNRNALKASFLLSPGAYAKVSNNLQVSGNTINNFSTQVIYSVSAENREIHKDWLVKVTNAKNSVADFKTFTIPGITRSVSINTILKTIDLELIEGSMLSQVPVQFELSFGARAFINNVEQFSNAGLTYISDMIHYKILAEDGINSSAWTINILNLVLPVKETDYPAHNMTIYPNPSSGIVNLQFTNILSAPVRVDIFNTSGEKIYSHNILNTGNFTFEADLTSLPAGIYLVKCSHFEKPLVIVISK